MAASEQRTGCYVYGIVPADVEADPDARGVGDPPGQITVVRHDEIAALVSEVGLDAPLGRPEDLLAHEQLLDAAATSTPVLPLRFGAVLTNRDAVVEELLAPHVEDFRAALAELEDRAEYVVKGRYEERAMVAEVLDSEEEAARLREEIRDQPEDATRPQRIRLGEIIGRAVAARREADTREVVEALRPHCAGVAVREPTHELDAVHVAVLVENSRRQELDRAVDEFADKWADRVEFRLLGPLAPYDFVTSGTRDGG
ncbi:MAG: GvpL/GvpF family gas vesicle protein [Mycobacteriales bacterium]